MSVRRHHALVILRASKSALTTSARGVLYWSLRGITRTFVIYAKNLETDFKFSITFSICCGLESTAWPSPKIQDKHRSIHARIRKQSSFAGLTFRKSKIPILEKQSLADGFWFACNEVNSPRNGYIFYPKNFYMQNNKNICWKCEKYWCVFWRTVYMFLSISFGLTKAFWWSIKNRNKLARCEQEDYCLYLYY